MTPPAILIMSVASTASGFTITGFAPTVYDSNTAAMDAALGVTGHVVEDFEDLTFAPGLTIAYETHGIFPHDFDTTSDANWDTTRNLKVYGGTTSIVNTGPRFSFAEGLSSFGIGIGNMTSTDWFIEVNATTTLVTNIVGQVPNFDSIGNRNVYLIIEPEAGETIDSVFIHRTPGGDRIHLDHLTFEVAVPEPATAQLLVWGLIGLAIQGRRRRA